METVFKRWFALISGLIIFALGLAFIIQANLGLGPWDVLHQGLSRLTGIPIGAVSIPVGLLIMLAWLPLGQRPGWGTLVNVVLIGVVIDLTLAILPHVEDMPIRGLLLAGSIIVTGVGSGLYLSANIGAGPRDGLMLGLAQRTGWSVRRVRTLLELIALVSGWLLGGAIGIGTVAFAFGIGPVVQVALRVFAGSGEGVKG